MRGGDIHDRTSFLILCNASMKINGQSAAIYTYCTLTQIFPGRKAKIYLRTTLKLTEFMPISCLMRSRRHLDFLNVVTSTLARHSLNARNVINLKRNFKKRIFKKYLGERIKKEVVIIRIESYFSAFH